MIARGSRGRAPADVRRRDGQGPSRSRRVTICQAIGCSKPASVTVRVPAALPPIESELPGEVPRTVRVEVRLCGECAEHVKWSVGPVAVEAAYARKRMM